MNSLSCLPQSVKDENKKWAKWPFLQSEMEVNSSFVLLQGTSTESRILFCFKMKLLDCVFLYDEYKNMSGEIFDSFLFNQK